MLLFPTGVSGATDSSSMLLAISWRISSVIDSARDRGRGIGEPGARGEGRRLRRGEVEAVPARDGVAGHSYWVELIKRSF